MDFLCDNAGSLCTTVGAITAVTGAAALYYLTKMPDPTCIPPIDLDDQSVVLPDGSRGSKLTADGKLLEYLYEDVRTLHDCFMRGLKLAGSNPCLGQRTGPNQEYEWMSYQEVYDQSVAFGSWLLTQGLKSGTEAIVGIYSKNRIEWVLTEKACCAFNFVPVALYTTLGTDASVFILNQTAMTIMVCDNAEKTNAILKLVADGSVRSLKCIVVCDDITDVDQSLAKKCNISIVSFQDALTQGKANIKPISPPKPEDLALICYTSGTTGSNPKGAMVTQKQAVANISAIYMCSRIGHEITKDDVHISYLPLAHMLERMAEVMFFMQGARIGFFRGDIKLLVDDIQTLKPTYFICVPRLLNKIYDKVMGGVAHSKLKSTLLRWALASKMKEVRKFVFRRDSIWDMLVFKKIQALLGGRVKLLITGSAPLAKEVLDFYRCSLGCVVMEGYGQTEAVAGVTFVVPGEYESGMVGPPLPCNYVKLVDVADYGYFAKNNQGEVCVKGTNVTSGYYKDPERTAETWDRDDWLHTGDIGEWLPNGTLKIIDRKKNIFKLSQGEYIAPEKLENVYCRSTYVAQAFVDGDSLQPYVMSIIVPEEETLMTWAKLNGVTGTFKELCQSESVKGLIMSDINKKSEAAALNSIEKTKDILLCWELFSVENGMLTPTFKNKRPLLRARFKEDIAELYKKHKQG